ncbi:methyltransferase domain-containing protein [Pseudomonas sp. KU26590]|uniref:class I SAM-dependent methyltransferase n=1 Tax=Pseudomonas sp. KU26590 TaxID=2991051 RepID=UPI00223C92D6|nr:methyltransferase domain-containing protein [Pseudomonas sp. KU26590]UZJ61120.1 methyltransferase domain-containing protein [Pseudomonas sp. KU26590]
MDDRFYRAFEDRYRGSRAIISERLEAYLPFLAPLKTLREDLSVLDLGCGRGEWLELLGREGFQAFGVDLDDGMLEACSTLGLRAQKGDALVALQRLPDNSLVAVTGFHIAEHVPFKVLQHWVTEALRVLCPGGLLILETPNAESLVVGTNHFYLDPTHERPLPNLLLSFLTEHSGFARSKIVRLQETPALRDETNELGLWDVLSGTSPDYAVVAQKLSDPEELALFDSVFESSYGVSLDQLAVRYDLGLKSRFSELEEKMSTGRADYLDAMESVKSLQAEQLRLMQERYDERITAATAKAEALVAEQIRQVEQLMLTHERYAEGIAAAAAKADALLAEQMQQSEQLQLMQKRYEDSLSVATAEKLRVVQQQRDSSIEAAAAQLEAVQAALNESLSNAHNWYVRATTYEQKLTAFEQSTSWRITAPLRLIVHAIRWPFRSNKPPLRQTLGRGLVRARRWVAERPSIQRPVMAVVTRIPWVSPKLRALYVSSLHPDPTTHVSDPQHGVIDHAPLSQRGRAIEAALRNAMTKGRN